MAVKKSTSPKRKYKSPKQKMSVLRKKSKSPRPMKTKSVGKKSAKKSKSPRTKKSKGFFSWF